MLQKKVFVLIAVLFAVNLCGQTVCRAQGKQSNVLYAEPSRLVLPGDENAEHEESGQLLREKFYPIGWSINGAFAYYVEPADEACDCYFAQLVIQDLRTDKILWERSSGEETTFVTLKSYWAKHKKEFSRKLAEHGIRAQKQFVLQNFPINFQTDVLTPELAVNTTGEDFDLAGDVVLQLVSREKGKKTIYKKIYDPKKYEGFRGAQIAGSLTSPFEPRAAIIMSETRRGYEGPPHTTITRIVGTSLATGFR